MERVLHRVYRIEQGVARSMQLHVSRHVSEEDVEVPRPWIEKVDGRPAWELHAQGGQLDDVLRSELVGDRLTVSPALDDAEPVSREALLVQVTVEHVLGLLGQNVLPKAGC